MKIEAKAAAALTVAILLNGYASVARADESPTIPQTQMGLSAPCGTSPADEGVKCHTTGSEQPAALAGAENGEAGSHRNERISARVTGALGGAFMVAGTILRLGVIGVAACAIYAHYCVALVLVGASVGAAVARP